MTCTQHHRGQVQFEQFYSHFTVYETAFILKTHFISLSSIMWYLIRAEQFGSAVSSFVLCFPIPFFYILFSKWDIMFTFATLIVTPIFTHIVLVHTVIYLTVLTCKIGLLLWTEETKVDLWAFFRTTHSQNITFVSCQSSYVVTFCISTNMRHISDQWNSSWQTLLCRGRQVCSVNWDIIAWRTDGLEGITSLKAWLHQNVNNTISGGFWDLSSTYRRC